MGVLTAAYSISSQLMRKIRADEDNLRFVFGICDDRAARWKIEKYEFDKHFEEKIGILRVCGYQKTLHKLNFENFYNPKYKNFWNYAGCNIWLVTPAELRIISGELSDASFENLKICGLRAEAADYFGKTIPAEMYEYYVGDIEEIKKFFQKSAGQENYLLFVAV